MYSAIKHVGEVIPVKAKHESALGDFESVSCMYNAGGRGNPRGGVPGYLPYSPS